MRTLLTALALLLVAAPAAVAKPVELTATAGDVRATLRGDAETDDSRGELLEDPRDLRLEIRRGDETFNVAVPPCRPDCQPGGFAGLHAEDLDGDGDPEVTVDRFIGGFVCCTGSATIFRYDPTGRTYVPSRRQLGSDYALRNLDEDKALEIVSDDARFYTRFTPRVAGVYLPIRILEFRAGSFSIVTKEHPEAIRRQRDHLADRVALLESRLRRKIDSRHANVIQLRAIAPALVADDRLLGERARGEARLRRGRRIGWASRGYVRDLRGFLRRTGY